METKQLPLITDGEGYAYSQLPELVELIQNTELPEELDYEEVLRLAAYAYNNGEHYKINELNADRLWEIWQQENENYEGDFATVGEFAEYYFTEMSGAEEPEWAVIDWEKTYDYSLRYDYTNTPLWVKDADEGFIGFYRFFWREG